MSAQYLSNTHMRPFTGCSLDGPVVNEATASFGRTEWMSIRMPESRPRVQPNWSSACRDLVFSANRQPRIGTCTSRRQPSTPRVVPARGDTKQAGHRGDADTRLIRTHEPVDRPGPVSRAIQAVAVARILRSSRSRRFSRRSRRSSSRSSVRRPSLRSPASRSACATQLRIAWADGSNSRANSPGVRPDRTSSTICCRNTPGHGGLETWRAS